MYHHHLNLSHENNPLMGHGRFSDGVHDSANVMDNGIVRGMCECEC